MRDIDFTEYEYIIYDYSMKDYSGYDAIIAERPKEYSEYREKLHPYRKRRCFKPKSYWNRIRSNPRR